MSFATKLQMASDFTWTKGQQLTHCTGKWLCHN